MCQAVLVDMEEGVVSEVVKGPLSDVFDHRQLITDVSGSGNNWFVLLVTVVFDFTNVSALSTYVSSQYGDGAGDTVQENHYCSVFFVIRMC